MDVLLPAIGGILLGVAMVFTFLILERIMGIKIFGFKVAASSSLALALGWSIAYFFCIIVPVFGPKGPQYLQESAISYLLSSFTMFFLALLQRILKPKG